MACPLRAHQPFTRSAKFLAVIGLSFLPAAFTSPAAAATWIVDAAAGPGFHYTDIPPAIVGAAPGDLLLVRTGVYTGFTLGKALAVVAETGHDPKVSGNSMVTAIPAGGAAVISGLEFKHMHLADCQGSVHLDDCTSAESQATPVLWIERCDLVTVSRCHLEQVGVGGGGMIEAGALIDDATVVISSSSLVGADGLDGFDLMEAYDGAAGIDARDSVLYVQSSSSQGGDGGDYQDSGGWLLGPGDGGHGIKVDQCLLHLFGDSSHVIDGGSGGITNYSVVGDYGRPVRAYSSTVAYSGITLNAPPGNQIVATSSVVTHVQPDLPVLVLSGSGEVGDVIEPTLFAAKGSQYLILFSPVPAVLPQAAFFTDFLLSPAVLFVLTAGTVVTPPVKITLPLSAALVPFRGLPIHFQAYVLRGSGMPSLSTSASFVLR